MAIPPRTPRNEVQQPAPADNPRNAPSEGALKKWGRRLLYATGIAAVLAIAGGAAYAGMDPATQKTVTDGIQKGWKNSVEGITKAGGYVSEQSQRLINAVRGRRNVVPDKPLNNPGNDPFRQFQPNPNNPFEPVGQETMPVPDWTVNRTGLPLPPPNSTGLPLPQ